MYKYNNNKKKRVLILFLITSTLSFLNVGQFIWDFDNSSVDPNKPSEFELLKKPKISDYSFSYSGTGENMNITLHQSYLNNSFGIELNASDPSNNTFYVPCPTDTTFNSSHTDIEITDIYAPNRTIVVEDDDEGSLGFHEITGAGNYLSFETESPGYITNISLKLKELNDYDTYIVVKLFDSVYSVPLSRIIPNNEIATLTSKNEVNGTSYFWWNLGTYE